ncbi:MAG: hypothetical protein GX951_01150 [Mollicutes bacterium]|nr:hypothetical protein [Mollicutes bacterium]
MFLKNVNPYNVCAFLISTLLLITYFSKRRVKSVEIKLYDIMVFVSFLGTIITFFTYLIVLRHEAFASTILLLIPKIHLTYLIVWGTTFALYIINISMKDITLKKWRVLKWSLIIFSTICTIIMFLLDMEYVSEPSKIYTSGASVHLTYLLALVYTLIVLYFIIKNIKNIIDKRYTPIITFIIFFVLGVVFQYKNPEVLLATFIVSYNTLLMYFTIENPDVILLTEYKRAKERSDLMNEEKAEFILDIAQEIKNPISKVRKISKQNLEEEDIQVIKNGCLNISLLSDNILNVVDKALNIAEIDKYKLKMINSIYDPNKLFNELQIAYSNNIKNKELSVDFRCDFANTLPLLYGDVYQLKSVLKTILDDSLKHSDEGFIELKVDNVIKNDVCRLYISIIDSGYRDERNNNDSKFTLCETLLKTMGGTLLVNSIDSAGMEIKIILDQAIKVNKNSKIQRMDYTVKKYIGKFKILLNTDDEVIKRKFAKIFNKEEFVIDDTKEAFYKLQKNKKYDVVILDEKAEIYDGIKRFKNLKKNKKYDIPTMIIKRNINFLNDKEYLECGFVDIIDPNNLNNLEEKINNLK